MSDILLSKELISVIQFFFKLKACPFSNRSASEGSKDKVKNISEPKLLDQYIAKADYVKEGRNETSLREGQVVQVLEKTETGKPFDINYSSKNYFPTQCDLANLNRKVFLGWWFVNSDYDQGWVPSSYLEREDGLSENRVIKSTESGDKGKLISYILVN